MITQLVNFALKARPLDPQAREAEESARGRIKNDLFFGARIAAGCRD
jgi:hypothetical protein